MVTDGAKNPFSLIDKTVLVTGASSGIGKSIAIECSKMGASMAITGRDSQRLSETFVELEKYGEHVQLLCDLTKAGEINTLVDNLPQLDGVVLCAGKGNLKPFLFSDRKFFDDIFNLNFFSPIELLRVLSKKKKLNRNASVVFIVSIAGTKRYTIGNSVYGSSKAALNAMIHYCAQELSNLLIRVNGICPGMIETPLIHQGSLTEEQKKADMNRHPLKRYGKPEDVAYGAIYLLSDASSWITGHSLVIDGGITTL